AVFRSSCPSRGYSNRTTKTLARDRGDSSAESHYPHARSASRFTPGAAVAPPSDRVYNLPHDRGDSHSHSDRARRPARRGTTLAAGVRGTAQTRGAETRPRTARTDAASDRPGARGVSPAGGCGQGPALE